MAWTTLLFVNLSEQVYMHVAQAYAWAAMQMQTKVTLYGIIDI